MTWDARDIRPQGEPSALPPSPPVLALPRQEVLARMHDTEEATEAIPREVQREMAQAGLVDDETWARWRQLMTRGVYEHSP